MYLRLNIDFLHCILLKPCNLDFTVKVSNIADNRIILHVHEMLSSDNILATSCSNKNLALFGGFIHSGNLHTTEHLENNLRWELKPDRIFQSSPGNPPLRLEEH